MTALPRIRRPAAALLLLGLGLSPTARAQQQITPQPLDDPNAPGAVALTPAPTDGADAGAGAPAQAATGLTAGSPALDLLSPDSTAPLEIEADGGLEWDQPNKTYIARGNALARRGDAEVRAQQLVAHYRETAQGGQEIYLFEATGDVVITNANNRASGDKATYDLDERVAVLTGGDLRLEAQGSIITAEERLEYFETEQRARAVGNAQVVREGNTLAAEVLTARFADDAQGALALSTVDAEGGVRISTQDRIATGQKGTYDAGSQVARLTGNVELCQENAARATGPSLTVNMATGEAELAGGGSGRRSRLVLSPGAQPAQGFDACAGLR